MTVTIENTYTGNGSTTDYSFTFPYLDTTDIKASLATVNTTAFTLLNATTVRFNTAPGNGVAIRIYRETAFATPKATFYPGSAIRANDLNDNTLQNLYVNQESNDKVADAWLRGDQTVISTESWHTSDDTKVASTKAIDGRIDTKIDTALTSDVVGGNKITVTDNNPGSGQITVGVTSGSLVNSDINASAAIAGTKVTPNFGAQNIVTSGTVDGRDVSADGVKLDGIETAATADQTAAEIRTLVESASDSNVFTDADHSKLNAIEASATADQTDAEIRAAVESASDSNVFTDADHSKLNAIEASATADQTASEIKTLLQSDKLTASEIATSALNNSHYSPASISADKFNADTVITNSEQSGASVNDTSFFTSSASDARYFNVSTGDTIKDGDTFPDNDTTIATTAAINDRIIDLVEEVGGFVPIANETSFPNANPDVNNGAGTLVSIKALSSNLTSNGSGVATISNGTLGNSTVTINGLENSTTYGATLGMIVETTSTLNTYTFHRVTPKATEVTTVASNISNVNTVGSNTTNINTVAGANSNITTVAGSITNVNTVGTNISNVNTVSANISSVNDFAARYRVASSAPTSSLDTGDLYFDTSGNELKVYNGSAWQGGVTATGNLLSKAGDQMTGNLTFSGSQTVDGRDLSVDGAKLDGIETGATADQTNAEIRTAVEAASDSNVFTDADHSKLNAIEANATADQTNAEIRAAVEAASDSNVFTDSDHSKLNGIEAGATADQSKSEIEALNINADTVDSLHAASFLRSDADDTMSQHLTFTDSDAFPVDINNSNNGKILLQGSVNPFIQIRENTTDKAYIQWHGDGYLKIKNEEDSSTLLIRDDISFSTDGSNFNTVWHAGNDGSGSGLDADTLDGVQGNKYLTSYSSSSTTGWQNSNCNFRITSGGTATGLVMHRSDGTFGFQLYADGSNYGFLDANWGGWDIRKTPNGAFYVDEGSGLERVVNAGNVGSSGSLSGRTVYVSVLRATNTSVAARLSSWQYFESTTDGIYWNGGGGSGWHIHPGSTSNLKFRSGSSSNVALQLQTNGVDRGYVYATSSNHIGFLNSSGSWIFRSDPSGGATTIFGQDLLTNTDSTYDIGTNSTRWRNVYADNLYGDGSNLTNLPAGGAAFTATADGALGANKAVYVQSNGTVKQVDTITTPQTFSSSIQNRHVNVYLGGGDNEIPNIGYDAAHHKLIQCGKGINGAASNAYWGVNVSSVGDGGSDGYITGTHRGYDFGDTTSHGWEYRPQVVYSPDNEMTAVFYGGSGTGKMRLIECTTTDVSSSSPNTYNVSSAHTFQSTADRAQYLSACYHTGENKFVLAWADDDNNKGYIQTCTVTGTTSSASVSFGTPVEFRNAQVKYLDMAFDSNTNKIYLTYWRSGNNLSMRYITVSGTSISLGSESLITNNLDDGGACAYDPVNNKLMAMWWKSSANRAVAGTPGSSSVSWGSEQALQSGGQNGYKGQLIFEPKSGWFINSMLNNNRVYVQKVRLTSGNSGRTIETGGNSYTNSSVQEWGMCAMPAGDTHTLDGYFFLTHKQNANTYGSSFRTTQTKSNIPGPNYFVGFPDQAYSNGQTATIQTYGSVVEGFSGLSPGYPYYVQPDGTISNTYSSQYWPVGDGYTWDDSSNSAHPNRPNSWNPTATSGVTYSQFNNAPIAGLAVGTNKILMLSYPHTGAPFGSWQDYNHTHGMF